MKRVLTYLATALFVLLMPTTVMAQVRFDPTSTPVNQIGGCDGTAANSTLCTEIKSDKNPLFGKDGILTKVAGIFALATGIISVFIIIISGLRYINSGGDPSKTASAKNGIMYAAIGVTVAVVAQGIVSFVLSKL